MSEDHSTNGTGGKRRSVAKQSVEGHILAIHFVEAGEHRSYDVHKIPGAEHVNGMLGEMLAYATGNILQNAYGAPNVLDHVAVADGKWQELVSGSWKPGRTYNGVGAEPDALAMAFAEYRTKQGRETMNTVESFDAEYVPFYMEKTGIKSVAAAKRAIGQVAAIAAIRARIMSERAGAAAKAAKGKVADDLL